MVDWTIVVWNTVHVAATAERYDADYLAALENETTTLQKRVDACRSRIMLVTCFDVTVWQWPQSLSLQPAAAAAAVTVTVADCQASWLCVVGVISWHVTRREITESATLCGRRAPTSHIRHMLLTREHGFCSLSVRIWIITL